MPDRIDRGTPAFVRPHNHPQHNVAGPHVLSRRSFLTAAGAASAGALFAAPPDAAAHIAGAASAGPLEMSLGDVADRLRHRRLSSLEITRACLARIAALNPALNAFITVTGESALVQARTADDEMTRGAWRGPLHGVPIALKDLRAQAFVNGVSASGAVVVSGLATGRHLLDADHGVILNVDSPRPTSAGTATRSSASRTTPAATSRRPSGYAPPTGSCLFPRDTASGESCDGRDYLLGDTTTSAGSFTPPP